MKHVVIVESPAKCKTIHKYLGKDYTVLASFGHIRDLPSKDGSVRPDEDFAMDYQISSDSKKHVKTISDAVKGADSLILATDPDREGEAISWHVLEALKKNKALKKDTKVERVSFNSITKRAVNEAIANPRELDMDLVNAQQARRALDYLVGFNLSPVLWRKLPGSKSAGRVQSVALRLICERETDIEKFNNKEYWDIKVEFTNEQDDKFTASLTHIDNKKLAKFDLPEEKIARSTAEEVAARKYKVAKIEKKQSKRNPYAPFTTSTLQQDASRKLGFSAKKTMMVAQKLYEGIALDGETVGLITYMRTDAVIVAPEAIAAARNLIESRYGKEYLPEKNRFYASKAKNAQEAHEAIRPSDPMRVPEQIRNHLNDDQYKLYDLIWKRLIASQMESVIMDQVAADIVSEDGYATLRANGSTIRFDGFYKAYKEGRDDDAKDDDNEKTLPPLSEGENTAIVDKENNPLAAQHFTQPPPRFTEASLVKKLEELGIGRPSTYASIISVLQDREYVILEKKRFVPEMRGRLVTAFLTEFFSRYVQYDFTANLEDELDNVAAGKMDWKQALGNFWKDFNPNVEEGLKLEYENVTKALDESLDSVLYPGEGTHDEKRKCPSCSDGIIGLKTGRFGAFLGCSNYPECKNTKQIDSSGETEASDGQDFSKEPKLLGVDKKTGKEIILKKGPYGFYVQLGEPEGKEKPKRASVQKGTNPDDVTLEMAEGMLALPRIVGTHPETGKEIKSNVGRYGPYLQHDGKFTSLKGDDNILTITLERAVTVIAEAPIKKGAEPIKILGKHPDDNEDIAIYDGRYGPYVKHKKLNASLTKGMEVETLTIEQAIELLATQAAKKKPTKKKAKAKPRTKAKPKAKKKT